MFVKTAWYINTNINKGKKPIYGEYITIEFSLYDFKNLCWISVIYMSLPNCFNFDQQVIEELSICVPLFSGPLLFGATFTPNLAP